MNRKQFLAATFSGMLMFGLSGCGEQSLSSLKVGPNDKVATYQVIDGM